MLLYAFFYRRLRFWPAAAFLAAQVFLSWELLMSLLYLGGEAAQIGLELPSAVTRLFQGMLLFFLLATDVFIGYRLRFRRSPGPAAAAESLAR